MWTAVLQDYYNTAWIEEIEPAGNPSFELHQMCCISYIPYVLPLTFAERRSTLGSPVTSILSTVMTEQRWMEAVV